MRGVKLDSIPIQVEVTLTSHPDEGRITWPEETATRSPTHVTAPLCCTLRRKTMKETRNIILTTIVRPTAAETGLYASNLDTSSAPSGSIGVSSEASTPPISGSMEINCSLFTWPSTLTGTRATSRSKIARDRDISISMGSIHTSAVPIWSI